MNRSEFIQTIMELYPNTFHPDNKAQYQGWINRYKSALPESWNYDKLLKIFDNRWQSTVVPPHPSFFLEFSEDVRPPKIRKIEPAVNKEETRKNFQEFQKKMSELIEKHRMLN